MKRFVIGIPLMLAIDLKAAGRTICDMFESTTITFVDIIIASEVY